MRWNAQVSALERLERWYAARCNGDWEHQYGIHIGTLDNPGWLLKIGLSETIPEGSILPRTKLGRSEVDWIHYWTEDRTFNAACGAQNLAETIDIFCDWFDSLV